MKSPNRTTQEEVIALIYRVAKQMHHHMEPGEREELSPGQLHALFTLSKGPCTAGGLAQEVNVTLPTATALVDRLVSHGWVERSADPSDRRIVRLELTAEGAVTLERAKLARYKRLSFLLDAMSDEDLASLHRIFSHLHTTLDKSKPHKVAA